MTYLFVAWFLDRYIHPHITDGPRARRTPAARLGWTLVLFVLSMVLNGVLFVPLIVIRVGVALATGATSAEDIQKNPAGLLASAVPDMALFIFALVRMGR